MFTILPGPSVIKPTLLVHENTGVVVFDNSDLIVFRMKQSLCARVRQMDVVPVVISAQHHLIIINKEPIGVGNWLHVFVRPVDGQSVYAVVDVVNVYITSWGDAADVDAALTICFFDFCQQLIVPFFEKLYVGFVCSIITATVYDSLEKVFKSYMSNSCDTVRIADGKGLI